MYPALRGMIRLQPNHNTLPLGKRSRNPNPILTLMQHDLDYRQNLICSSVVRVLPFNHFFVKTDLTSACSLSVEHRPQTKRCHATAAASTGCQFIPLSSCFFVQFCENWWSDYCIILIQSQQRKKEKQNLLFQPRRHNVPNIILSFEPKKWHSFMNLQD